ncbi:hypothetical protein DYB30_009035 [Aphanomyces astaci]|uniref:Uncharacterized protein n=1 Tax=Aphanomyces astaci TaxID=112090 RepID=A0A397EQN3_APHAT|nr:hypothetical protein DYB36_012367 [Aphanomyces astaci]RHY65632.1 hypothetical protein DYB34_011775 [Aphanomyces astaci]RHY67014.1 hypothetical protein DYB30_009035 [Aphanomyces astaci]RHY90101.1 hypothetical protein DYB31_012589 [Aphanomyces astaci]
MSIINATAREANNCKLISGTFETLVQIGLGIIALSVLVLKRTYEKPQRPFQVWAYDASKQAIGAGVAHAANLFIAILLVKLAGSEDAQDEVLSTLQACGCLSVIGIVLILLYQLHVGHKFGGSFELAAAAHDRGGCGTVWLTQLLSWIAIVLTAKLVIARAIYAFSSPLNAFGNWLFEPLSNYPKLELLFVMVACPCLMNALQFWVTDNFLKKPAAQDARLIVDEKTPLV